MSMDKQRRKELQAQYKERKIMMGVVKITCLENGKVYVAAYPDLADQWTAIRSRLDEGLFSSGALVRDWKAYGPNAFTCEVLEEEAQAGETPERRGQLLRLMTKKWMDKLEPYDEKGYNRRPL